MKCLVRLMIRNLDHENPSAGIRMRKELLEVKESAIRAYQKQKIDKFLKSIRELRRLLK